ncbi:hypothetical protein DPMN_142622 [Dreissena polymorpha]|uniref:Uncharacterized protein n=1 Tax=Dreissena polymorpha TaxID=45954 RepID=A0A9D4JNM2_DREPO|nr:hypothetical protein DPMN_142622 [Dreissena polymorpha]
MRKIDPLPTVYVCCFDTKMAEVRIGAVCSYRGSNDNWRVIDTSHDGLVKKFLIRSVTSGEVKCVFSFEIFEKYTSTYKELDDFFRETTGFGLDDDTSFLDEEFDDIGEVPQPKRFKEVSSIDITKIKQQNTEKTTNKQTKWAVNMLKGNEINTQHVVCVLIFMFMLKKNIVK